MKEDHRKIFFVLLIIWFLLNLVQATVTEVLSDEAYYGLYSKYLAWGYFDHPPMIALLIKVSSILFRGNLGIRFTTVLLQVFTLFIIWNIIDEKQPDRNKVYSFFIIAASICLFSAYGFITTPDVPLLFFTALFLCYYRKYLENEKWINVIMLSLAMAGLVYSKYQAVLVIGFVVLSNLRLLLKYRFWLAGIFAVILLGPHIWWQISNDFPSFKFHLVDRSDEFRWMYILEYVPNQLASFNPLVLGAVFYLIFRNRAVDLFTRALYFLVVGIIGFFWIMTIRGHAEPNWTVACSVPLIILLYNNSTVNPKMFRFVRRGLVPSLLIILGIRVFLVMNIPVTRSLALSGKKEKYEFIGSVAGDLPVLFLGSFPKPSLYSFYTGKVGLAINSLHSRKTQFDIWQFEKRYNNKPAFICGFGENGSTLYKNGGFEFYGYATDSLQTVNRIDVVILPGQKVLRTGDSLSLTLKMKSNYDYDIDFNHKKFPVEVCLAFVDEAAVNLFPVTLNSPVNILSHGETITRTLSVKVPDLPAGKYHFGVCLQTLLGPAINNSFSEIKLIKQ